MSLGYITKKVLNMDNNVFSLNYDKSDPIKPMMKLMFMSLVKNRYNSKFTMLKETIICFLKFSREEFINHFCKIQKTYYAFSRLAFLYKYKKSTMSVTTDIGLNDITINDKHVLCIYHVNSRYLFNVNDLIKIINTSLTNSYMLFSQPLMSKNPYNNLPFTKSNLYNIYFFIKSNTNIYNDLFFKFFHCDFNLSLFYHKYEYLLREYVLESFIKNTEEHVIAQEIKRMISSYNKKTKKKILINDEFPKKRLIQIMKPYLLLHLKCYYSLIPSVKNKSNVLLNNKLRKFQKFNPQFGRKIYKLGFKWITLFKKKSYMKSIIFLDKHIPFNSNENANFLTNHKYYDEIYSNDDDEETPYLVTFGINIYNQNQEEEEEDDEEEDEEDQEEDHVEDDQEEDEEDDEEEENHHIENNNYYDDNEMNEDDESDSVS
jgi:hypothetical protein